VGTDWAGIEYWLIGAPDTQVPRTQVLHPKAPVIYAEQHLEIRETARCANTLPAAGLHHAGLIYPGDGQSLHRPSEMFADLK
jgi:hypothetical protein